MAEKTIMHDMHNSKGGMPQRKADQSITEVVSVCVLEDVVPWLRELKGTPAEHHLQA